MHELCMIIFQKFASCDCGLDNAQTLHREQGLLSPCQPVQYFALVYLVSLGEMIVPMQTTMKETEKGRQDAFLRVSGASFKETRTRETTFDVIGAGETNMRLHSITTNMGVHTPDRPFLSALTVT